MSVSVDDSRLVTSISSGGSVMLPLLVELALSKEASVVISSTASSSQSSAGGAAGKACERDRLRSYGWKRRSDGRRSRSNVADASRYKKRRRGDCDRR